MKIAARALLVVFLISCIAGCVGREMTKSARGLYPDDSSTSFAGLVQKLDLAEDQKFAFEVSTARKAWEGDVCRLGLLLYMPGGKTVDSYVNAKGIEVLKDSGMYSSKSSSAITIDLKEFELDSIDGIWTTTGDVRLPDGSRYTVNSEHYFETSAIARPACIAAENNIAPAIRQFLKTTLNHSEFKKYVRQFQETSSKKPADVNNDTSSTAASVAPVSSVEYKIPPSGKLNYHALIIGNADYQDFPHLGTAVNDARAVDALLKSKYGFKTQLLLNATRHDILLALHYYRTSLTPNDALLIYYAGHGWLDSYSKDGYWLPVNANKSPYNNWLTNSAVTASLAANKARHVLVVADSCYVGTLPHDAGAEMRTPNHFDSMMKKKARTILSSGSLEPVAEVSGDGKHSVFADSFLKVLNGNNSTLDGAALFSQVQKPVMLSTGQTPEYSDIKQAGHDGGDFLFIRAE